MGIRSLTARGLAAALLAMSGTVWAAQPDGPATVKPKATETRQAAPDTSQRVEELEALVIEGRIPKPQVFYVLDRSERSYRARTMHRSFVREIVDSLKRNPL